MNGKQKITPEHLRRRAVVYLRQSSDSQVQNNLESQRLQYALADRVRSLGFGDVEVIDSDLGASAAVAARRRQGFERLLGAVALGEVGLVISRELSRLMRTDKDYGQLVELCQVFGVLVADEESIYDPARTDDQLVLGIKATMSVVELKVLRMRLQQGAENKARRGELYPRLPPGYVWSVSNEVVKDPNLRVQEAIELLFSKFRELWSVRQTFQWFLDNEIQLPVTKHRGGTWVAVFQTPRLAFVSSVLHNPFYAGAYCWGRRPTEFEWKDGVLRKRQSSLLPSAEARVFIRDHHEAYVDWLAFEENQRMIRRNSWRTNTDGPGVARSGHALLAGLLRCGRCGRNLHVSYWGTAGTPGRYQCTGDEDDGPSNACLGFGGARVDRRFGDEVVTVLSPLGVRASLEALERAGAEKTERDRVLRRQIEQLEYEAQRAFEQYDRVDARNRLVAADLERRWNDKLFELERARAQFSDAIDCNRQLSADDRSALLSFGERFSDVWHHSECPIEIKKQIVRTLVEGVVVNEDPPGRLSFVVHWKGGAHTIFEMEKPNSKTAQRTAAEDLEIIRKMASRYDDAEVTRVLNKLGRRTGKGNRWTATAVKTARRNHGIEREPHAGCDSEILTMQAAARYTGTSDTTIKKLVDGGVLPMTQVTPFAPWEIRRADLDAESIRRILDRLKRTGRLTLKDTSAKQSNLFQENQGDDHAR